MTNEEKKLLKKKDLLVRLPYGVKATTTSNGWSGVYAVSGCKDDRIYLDCPIYDEGDDEWLIESVKPFLRKISSMTEEEKIEFSNIFSKWFDEELFILSEETFLEYALSQINYSISHELFDWLNAHHFDYRGLIEMGLAIEAPEGMYNF